MLRLRTAPTDAQLAELNERFADTLSDGPIARTTALPEEVADSDALDLPRLVLRLRQRNVGSLHLLIRALNAF